MDPENNDRALTVFIIRKYGWRIRDLYLRSLLPVEVTRVLRNVKLYDNKMNRMANIRVKIKINETLDFIPIAKRRKM